MEFHPAAAGNVSHLEFDPRQPSTVYATYTTFDSAPGDGHVYRSTDSGVTWTRIDGSGSSGLPDVPVETLLVDPDESTRLYLGTDLGVFASLDGGNTWAHDDDPFANVITSTLAIDRNTGGQIPLRVHLRTRSLARAFGRPGRRRRAPMPSRPRTSRPMLPAGTYSANITTSANCGWMVTPVTGNFASVQGPGYGAGSGQVFFTVPANHGPASLGMTVLVQNQR